MVSRSGSFGRGMVLAGILAASLSACAVRPQMALETEFAANAAHNLQRLAEDQEPIEGPVTLAQAMARAFKYNLELRLKQDEISLQLARLGTSNAAMLPDIATKSGYVSRNSWQASTSLDLTTGRIDPSPSTSQDRSQFTSEITFGWDILDFGLSWVRANQSADEVLVAGEQWRTALNRLMEEVRVAHARAAMAQRLLERLRRLDRKTDRALNAAGQVSASNQPERLKALGSERELVRIKQSTAELEQELADARGDLARLMNLRPGTTFAVDISPPPPVQPFVVRPLEELFEIALIHRPELRENLYRQRINLLEAKAVVLDVLPGLRLYGNGEYGSNSFLVDNLWASAGASISWSIIKLFSLPSRQRTVEAREELLDTQARAITAAIVSQVYLGLVRRDHLVKKVVLAERFLSVQNRLARQMRIEADAGRISEHEAILEELNEMLAEARLDMARVELQRADAGLIASLGLDAEVELEPTHGVDDLAIGFDEYWANPAGWAGLVIGTDPVAAAPGPGRS